MEIFKELTTKGYKHYYEGTVEELDSMDKNNQHLHSEIMQVIMWLYEKHGIWIVVQLDLVGRWYYDTYTIKDGLPNHNTYKKVERFTSPTEAYEAAIKYCLTNLI